MGNRPYDDVQKLGVAMPTLTMANPDSSTSSSRHAPNPYRDEQNPAILEVFARADYPVLTTKEIAEELDHIGLKQTRRRLRNLVDGGVVETRKPSRDRIWWLVEEVEEPITVRYPLLRHVRNRFEVLIAVIGAGFGLIGAFAVMLFLGLNANNIAVPFISRNDILVFGLYAIGLGMAGMIGGLSGVIFVAAGRRIHKRVTALNNE